MDPALERRFHMRDKFERMKREIADDEFKIEDWKNFKRFILDGQYGRSFSMANKDDHFGRSIWMTIGF